MDLMEPFERKFHASQHFEILTKLTPFFFLLQIQNPYYYFQSLNVRIKPQGAEDELKHAVAFVRPVSVAFEVVDPFRSYSGGVYTSTTCGSDPMVILLE